MNNLSFHRRISLAPMMGCTDRHFRYLLRLISFQILLYTEMVTSGAIIHGDRNKLLHFDKTEHPLALQLGGNNPEDLAKAAKIAADYGYDEINLNVGCPSDRVQKGQFGACLMKQPLLVAECVKAMQAEVFLPVTVKCRIGVDEQDSYAELVNFIGIVSQAGCKTFILHARKAWLQGLSPRENRSIPPLHYDRVYALKKDFSHLEIIINGGIQTLDHIRHHLQFVDGVMIGREAYSNPWLFAEVDREFYGLSGEVRSIHAVVLNYLPYVAEQLSSGVRLRSLIRHLVGLFNGYTGARFWRRYLSENGGDEKRGVRVIEEALKYIG